MADYQEDPSTLLVITPSGTLTGLKCAIPVICVREGHELYGSRTLLVDAVQSSPAGDIIYTIEGGAYSHSDFELVYDLLRKISETLRPGW